MKEWHFKLGELFCGPGGMAIAANLTEPVINELAQIKCTIEHDWGVDISEDAINTFKQNLGYEKGIHQNARDFVKTGLTQERKINALAFGFPCNSFSSVGEREGINSKDYGTLYQAGIAVLKEYSPDWFIAENVSGISKHESGSQFKRILKDLANAGKGYNTVAHLYKFEEYGVPQARHRYVIVGIRSDIAKKYNLEFKIPAPTHGNGRIPFVSVQDALKNVNETYSWGTSRTRQSEKVVWRLKFTPPGENAWKLDELVNSAKYPDDALLNYLQQSLPWYQKDIAPLGDVTSIREKIEWCRLHCKKARMSHIYRRLVADKPAYTLTGSGGGGTHVYHWEEHRALTNAERAALQSFPPNFTFSGTPEAIRKQIGMAVPTKGALVIFESILKTFAKVPYDSIEADSNLIFFPSEVDAKLGKD